MSKVRRLAANLAVALASVAAGLFAIEIGLRWLYPITIATVQVGLGERAAPGELMVPDASLGLRPNLNSAFFDANGIGIGSSIHSKSVNPYTILFIGDSVTARGRIMRALAAARGSDSTSYLNGGVEAYNIAQEAEFFLRYQKNAKPDAIFHTLHVNDLIGTRLAHRNRDGVLSFHSPGAKPQNVNPWLYRHSQLYRFALARLYRGVGQEDLRAGARDALRQLRDYARANGIAYYAVLFPVLAPLALWSDYDRASRDHLLEMSRELEIGVVDLLPVAEALHARGVDPMERPGDVWHPNQIFADEAVRLILEKMPALRGMP